MSIIVVGGGNNPENPTRTIIRPDGAIVFQEFILGEWVSLYIIGWTQHGPSEDDELSGTTIGSSGSAGIDDLEPVIKEGMRFQDNKADRTFSTGELYPNVVDQRPAVDSVNWIQKNGVKVEDNVPAHISPDSDELSTALWCRDFKANLPPGATITGVKLRVRRSKLGSASITGDQGRLFMRKWVGLMSGVIEDYVEPNDTPVNTWGFPVAIDQTGSVIAVGSYSINGTGDDRGAVEIYTRSGSTWSHQQSFDADDWEASAFFGRGLSFNADGDVLAIGARDDQFAVNYGAVYIWKESGGTWSQDQKLVPPTPSDDGNFGWAVALSDDGLTLVASALNDDDETTNAGALYVYTSGGGSFGAATQILAGDSSSGGSQEGFGFELNISADGTRIAAACNQSGNEAIYIYDYSGSWSEYQKINFGTGSVGMAMSRDGTILAIPDEATDELWVYEDSGSAFVKIDTITKPAGASSSWGSRSPISISDNGSALIYCDDVDDSEGVFNLGKGYLYTRSGDEWNLAAEIFPAGEGSSTRFGWSVGVSGDGKRAVFGSNADKVWVAA